MTHDGHPDYPSRKELKDQRRAKLEVNVPMRQLVELVLKRMDEHPHEWWLNKPDGDGYAAGGARVLRSAPTPLTQLVNESWAHWNSKEKRAYEQKLSNIRMDEMYHWALHKLLSS